MVTELPETVVSGAGAVMETVGGVVSGSLGVVTVRVVLWIDLLGGVAPSRAIR